MDLVEGFLKWWTNDAYTIAVSVCAMPAEERLHGIQLLCRIAYAQGRIDECTRMTEELKQKISWKCGDCGGENMHTLGCRSTFQRGRET